jgi:FkbM family methyltransferase
MKILKILKDFNGISRVLGYSFAFGWLFQIARNMGEIVVRKDLLPADRSMGTGPFIVRYGPHVRFQLAGSAAFSGIREMYVRDVYLRGGLLTIRDGDTVVDLGANMGNFSNLALAHGINVRVVAVEPNASCNEEWRRSIGLNQGFIERTRLICAFVGEMGDKQVASQLSEDYADAKWVDEDTLIDISGISKIDLLKCDIEGGEFGLISPTSKLLAMTRQLAIEIHQFAGEVDAFITMVSSCGFRIIYTQRDPDGTATILAVRK